MKFSSISEEFFDLYVIDDFEVLHNKDSKRPYFIVVNLKYNGIKHEFAIPLRSNLAGYTPKEQYFKLPPSKTTTKNKIHGIHYIKMFPVLSKYLKKFHYNKDSYYSLINQIVTKNKDRIISEAQAYLDAYVKGERNQYATHIDDIFINIYSAETKEVAATKELENIDN